MLSLPSLLLSGLLYSQLTLAVPSLANRLEPILARQQESCNTATDRSCWTDGFDINTDYEISTPLTGVVRNYTLTLTEVDNWTGPDGYVKEKVMMINDDIIGPTIYAQWGDTISVRVINNLKTNGTSVHWHGIRQLETNLQDGVNGITECPLPPNSERVYTYIAHQYGTSWYHSHFSAQYGNGVSGPIHIDGPASLPYDIDLGPFVLSDYYHKTADELVIYTETNGAPPSDNVLFNGTTVDPTTGVGDYAKITLTPGKKHRLRLINTSVENHFQLSIVNHNMTIIGSDFVPVEAYDTDSLFIGVGQRFDVIIDADQDVDNYWFNVTYGGGGLCGSSNNPYPAAIVQYDGAADGNPSDRGTTPKDHYCVDTMDIVPVISRTVPTSFTASSDNTLDFHLDLTAPTFVWYINNSSEKVDWNKPLSQYIANNQTDYPSNLNIWKVDGESQWVYWLIENDPDAIFSLPHPIHLHGHDFVVLGRSPDANPVTQTSYSFDPSLVNGDNPVRRDVTMLPAAGWLLLAFKTDNPGAWLMHCHIAWHVAGGLSVTFLERLGDYRAGMNATDIDVLNSQCTAWDNYFPADDPYPQDDSGI
ncbi:Laccase [Cytospora mali]|uniref:laccase n=1 Tax=Cytospora mali TaxID=578113 RepID=A0A194VH66_CYTMA|nr:Laccase [Valsa mali]